MKKVIKGLASAKLTIFLFFALAATSVFGTLVAQGLPKDHYENVYGPGTVSLIEFFDISDMYHSWWFTVLLALLAVNLIACTAKTLPGICAPLFRKRGDKSDAAFCGWPIQHKFEMHDRGERIEGNLRMLVKALVGKPNVKGERDVRYLYAEKGAYARLGILFVHVSILIILAGGLIGAVGGFEGQMTIVEGETSSKVLVSPGTKEMTLPFSVRCNRFSVEFYDSGMPKEYRSDVTIIDEGASVAEESIRVNHPIVFRGYKLCQASYGMADASDFKVAVTEKKSGTRSVLTLHRMRKVPLPGSDSSFAVARFVPDFQGQGAAVLGVMLVPGMSHDIFWIPFQRHRSQEVERGEYIFALEDFTARYYTGIQISKNPGMPVVWSGFALILIGFVIVLFGSHRCLSIRITPSGEGSYVEVAAKTDRKRDGNFEKILAKHLNKLQQ